MHSIAALCPASAPIPVQGSKQASRSESNAHHPQCTCAHIRYHSQNALSRRSGLLRCCRMLERPQGNFFFISLHFSESQSLVAWTPCSEPWWLWEFPAEGGQAKVTIWRKKFLKKSSRKSSPNSCSQGATTRGEGVE